MESPPFRLFLLVGEVCLLFAASDFLFYFIYFIFICYSFTYYPSCGSKFICIFPSGLSTSHNVEGAYYAAVAWRHPHRDAPAVSCVGCNEHRGTGKYGQGDRDGEGGKQRCMAKRGEKQGV